MAWGLFCLDYLPLLNRLKSTGREVTTLGAVLREPLMNGVFKKPQDSGRGTKLVNVYDLYADTIINLDLVNRLDVSADDIRKYAAIAGDIFFTRSSLKLEGVAWSAYLEDDITEEAVFECHLIRARANLSRTVPGFISNYARTSLARAYLISRASVTTMSTIDQQGIAELPVILPEKPKQIELLSHLNTVRLKKKRQFKEADDLLANLDGFVLDALGITLPSPDSRTVYAVRAMDTQKSKKLYPDYFHPERIKTIKAIATRYKGSNAPRLIDIAGFIRDQHIVSPADKYLGLANVQPNTGERIESTEEDGKGNSFKYIEGDVLFARLRPYLNKVYRAESDGVCSTEFHVIRVHKDSNNKDQLIPDYVAAVLRSSLVLSQTRHMMTGNTHPRLTNEDVVNLIIPNPDWQIQQRVADEVTQRREKARQLRSDAELLWKEAKRRFEEELLGPETSAKESKTEGKKGGKRK